MSNQIFERIYQHQWISLPKNIREHLSKVFSLSESGIKEIIDTTVVSDGKTNNDLVAITKEKLVEYTNDSMENTFPRLFELAVSKARFEIGGAEIIQQGPRNPTLENVSQETPKPYCDTCPSTKGRHRKGCPKFK